MTQDDRTALELRIEALLERGAAADAADAAPLRAALADLYEAYRAQQQQFRRVLHVSDRYQAVARESSRLISDRSAKQARHLDKITRLSDRYQNMLRELNDALVEASTQDHLTGLGNRRRMMERLKESHALQGRSGTPFCIAMLDIDHFKKINDTYGHESGDLVLVQIARTLNNSLRKTDACGRWGGEEFLILLADTPLAAAHEVIQGTCRAIADLEAVVEGSTLHVTASIGLSQCKPDEPFSAAVKRADDAMYRAKRAGRNRVEVED